MSGAGEGKGQPPKRRRGGRQAVRSALAAAETVVPPLQLPPGFERRADGFYRHQGEGKEAFRICGPFDVLAELRTRRSGAWGLLLRWRNRDGWPHEWIMPRNLLAGEGVDVRRRLQDGGLDLGGTDGARRALLHLLNVVAVPTRVRVVSQTGWYCPAGGGGAAFILPGRAIGNVAGELVRLDLDPPPSAYRERGDLAGWRKEVARCCLGNSRLLFGVACAFAGPLLPLSGDEGGGFNLRGESSKGKTSIIDCSASVYGAPSKTGRIRS